MTQNLINMSYMKTFKIFLHILLVIPLCLLIFISPKSQQEKIVKYWCKKLLSIFKIKVELKGKKAFEYLRNLIYSSIFLSECDKVSRCIDINNDFLESYLEQIIFKLFFKIPVKQHNISMIDEQRYVYEFDATPNDILLAGNLVVHNRKIFA